MKQANLNPNLVRSSLDSSDPLSTALEHQQREQDSTEIPLITIFAIPKPFDSGTDQIQRNAINSWSRLGSDVDVLLIGDETGISQTAAELDVRHAGGLKFNQHGTPLVSSAFEIAHCETRSPFLVYCNCDLILMPDFVDAIKLLATEQKFPQLVAFGRRTDLKVLQEIDFDQPRQIRELHEHCKYNGAPASNVCKEYFVFSRDLYKPIPDFAVGRGNWDNWMIHFAKTQSIPVINLSDSVRVIHQEHDYSHASSSRYQCYVAGEEARENLRLAGGRHLISGSTPTWRLTPAGVVRENGLLLSRNFWADIPRFVRLMLSLLWR